MKSESFPKSKPGLSETLNEVGNTIYAHTAIFEDLEHQRRLAGNGHHVRQDLALNAQVVLLERWTDKAEVNNTSETHPAMEIYLGKWAADFTREHPELDQTR